MAAGIHANTITLILAGFDGVIIQSAECILESLASNSLISGSLFQTAKYLSI